MVQVYRMNRLRSLTKNQRDAVSDFLVALTRELQPAMMVKLLRKVILDIQQMAENVLVPLRVCNPSIPIVIHCSSTIFSFRFRS